jgi:hypothetical protein
MALVARDGGLFYFPFKSRVYVAFAFNWVEDLSGFLFYEYIVYPSV